MVHGRINSTLQVYNGKLRKTIGTRQLPSYVLKNSSTIRSRRLFHQKLEKCNSALLSNKRKLQLWCRLLSLTCLVANKCGKYTRSGRLYVLSGTVCDRTPTCNQTKTVEVSDPEKKLNGIFDLFGKRRREF